MQLLQIWAEQFLMYLARAMAAAITMIIEMNVVTKIPHIDSMTIAAENEIGTVISEWET
jgi:hypothetical protein